MDKVPGGYILLARRIEKMMHKPDLWLKLWVWMLLKARFRNVDGLQRGEFITSIEEMRDAVSYNIGYRKMKPSRDQIRKCYEGFTKATMITTAKTTHGIKITILNYEQYQDPNNYEAQTENHDESRTKAILCPHRGVHTYYKEKKSNLSRANKSKIKIPPDFSITAQMREWFLSQNFKHIEIESATADFVDHWKSEGELKSDWTATWRNGMRLRENWAAERQAGKPQSQSYCSLPKCHACGMQASNIETGKQCPYCGAIVERKERATG